MRESTHIWKPLKDNSVGPHWNRIENKAGNGMSDLNGCWRGIEAWVELKIFKGFQLIFQPSQLTWIPERIAAGGRVWVLARKANTLFLYNGLEAVRAAPNVMKTVTPVFETTKPWNWSDLISTIFKK